MRIRSNIAARAPAGLLSAAELQNQLKSLKFVRLSDAASRAGV
jgi:hypothetical protein